MKRITNDICLAFTVVMLACFTIVPAPNAFAVDPPPDGGYPNGNTAVGFQALFSNTTGSSNTATGFQALYFNKTGNGNTADGDAALASNTTGFANTATGQGALELNTTGNYNTAIGYQALFRNTTGNSNTVIGSQAMAHSTSGFYNIAVGANALAQNTTGSRNAGIGLGALLGNKTGTSNIALGGGALSGNTGSFNVAVGFDAGANLTTGHDNIDIGAPGVAGESNTMRLGGGKQTSTYIRGIYGQSVASGLGVIIDSTGHLGTMQSSASFKEAIQPMDKASETILALKPVTFRYKQELDPDGIPQFGLVAEQVEKVNPDLMVRGEDGKVMTVRYEAVNAMLRNEFLKEHKTVQAQQATITRLEKQVEALTAGLQKVSTAVELNKAAPKRRH